MIDSVGQDDLSHFEVGDGRPGHFFNPVIAAIDHGMQRVFVFAEQGQNRIPAGWLRLLFNHGGYFRVAFH